MRIVNLLAEPALWNNSETFALLKGLHIHGQPVGDNGAQIVKSLKFHFNINDQMKADLTSEVKDVVTKADQELQKYFATAAATVFIAGIDNSEEFANKNLGGVSGYAWPNTVLIFFNPERDWKKMFYRTTLHEFNHCQRYIHNNPSASFLDWLIFEGLAEEFEGELTGSRIDSAAHDKLVIEHLPEVQHFWDTMPPDAGDWFFGQAEKNIPFALGYRIGHYLVREFRRKKPGTPWAELIRLPSSEFVPSA